MSAPSMVHPAGDRLIIRSVVDGEDLYGANRMKNFDDHIPNAFIEQNIIQDTTSDEVDLPQCKIKRNYACNTCDYFTQNPRTYLHHLRDVHFEKIKIYECSSCLYASKHSQKLQRHIDMVHVRGAGKKRQPNKSKSSGSAATAKVFAPVKNVVPIMPVEIVSTPSLPMMNVDSSMCNTDSDENLMTEDDLRISSPISQGEGTEKQFRCSMCMFYSHNATLVSRHERVVHLRKKLFRCVKCNYVTHMKARFTKHVKYHSMPMIKCELCDFRTPYKWNLDRHWKNHTGEGAFKCSLCNFTADIKQSLTVHEMNHHVPSAGQGANFMRRRNRVGGSDLFQDEEESHDIEEQEMIRMEREDQNSSDVQNEWEDSHYLSMRTSADNSDSDNSTSMRQMLMSAADYERSNDEALNLKNGDVYTRQCRMCSFKTSWESELRHHETQTHGLDLVEKKKPARPIPNLIPIQGPPVGGSQSSPNGETPRKQDTSTLSDKELNDIYNKSSPNSSLKDFASVIAGGPDVFNTSLKEASSYNDGEKTNDSTNSSSSSEEAKKNPELFKKKNASFFDKLKEKLITSTTSSSEVENNLHCKLCSHVSKCLSEFILHQKLHANDTTVSNNQSNSQVNSATSSPIHNGGSASTRCQFCRQRCKSSSDLLIHLQLCTQALNFEEHSQNSSDTVNGQKYQNDKDNDEDEEDSSKSKVFVWNEIPCETTLIEDPEPAVSESDNKQSQQDSFNEKPASQVYDESKEDNWRSKSPSESSLMGYETTPGYGSVTSKTKSGSHGHINPNPPPDVNGGPSNDELTLKKVYKCPHCAFWASTASRFHVHIVGHLNKKPFECSLCAYRSNWRWDITKHIRLKTIRDPAHEAAKVLMTDETGRRNYTKYNKYLTLMKVHEPNAESSGSGKRSSQHKLTPNNNSVVSNTRMLNLQPNIVLHMGLSGENPFKRPASSGICGEGETEEPNAKIMKKFNNNNNNNNGESGSNKKTTWKCKKCLFRDGDRAVVLAHVKEHYRLAALNSRMESMDNESDAQDLRINTVDGGAREDSPEPNNNNENNKANEDEGQEFVLYCEMCEFKTSSSSDYENHLSVHYPREAEATVSYRCYKCNFSSLLKSTLMDHLQTHGTSQDDRDQFQSFDGRNFVRTPIITTEGHYSNPYL